MFTITKLHIYDNCKYRKNLKDSDYQLGHRINADFYSKNICVSAIVGKNGSGKSSVLDMIFRIINNVGYCLFNGIERNAAEPICYIKGIYADLEYNSNGNSGIISVRDGIVAIKYNDKKYRFIEYGSLEEEYLEIKPEIFSEYEEWKYDYSKIKSLALDLFYTVATNYSLQSLVSQDYKDELAIYSKNNTSLSDKSWINSIFNKNDGYLMPITLNPYRDNGVIDMSNEEKLTTMRLAAMMIEDDNDRPFINGYSFDDYASSLYPRTLQYKFCSIEDNKTRLYYTDEEVDEHNKQLQFKNDQWTKTGNRDLYDFRDIALKDTSYAYAILEALNCPVTSKMGEIQLYIRMYVVYKVLSIAAKYPRYDYYRQYVGNINYTFAEATVYQGGKDNLRRARQLALDIKEDKTHIGLKLKQALHFIENENKLFLDAWHIQKSYKDYCDLLGIKSKGLTVEERMEYLPPGIFKTSLTLKYNQNNKIIPLNHLSSGERQFLYLVSTIVYHALNIKSASNDDHRTIYKNLNIVLDEVEICFHPEYQRTFLKKFIDTIERMKLNEYFDINIIVTTHSPFILSDIPKDNILYLENGMVPKDASRFKNTFAANIGDILNQSFFLEDGFMGDVAQQKVRELVKKLRRKNSNLKNVDELISLIGDDFLKNELQKLYSNKKQPSAPLSNEARIEKIKQLEEELSKLKDAKD